MRSGDVDVARAGTGQDIHNRHGRWGGSGKVEDFDYGDGDEGGDELEDEVSCPGWG